MLDPADAATTSASLSKAKALLACPDDKLGL